MLTTHVHPAVNRYDTSLTIPVQPILG